MRLRARMRLELSHANTKVDTTTPAKTASAKLCMKTVINTTSTMTKTSEIGYRLRMRTLTHSNVPMATMIMTPVSAAIGSSSIHEEPTMTNANSATAAGEDDGCKNVFH